MITASDLHEAIAECQGERNPNAQTCIKLAAYYTILHEISGEPERQSDFSMQYSGDTQPATISIQSDSEFAQIVNGRKPDNIWELMDELMQTLALVNPRLYASVIRKLKDRA